MVETNPFRSMVEGYVRLMRDAAAARPPLPDLPVPSVRTDAARILVFSPHPDDECITGALPLRLRRECGARVINAPVTLGSARERRAERWHELERACAALEFELLPVAPGGLERIQPATREREPAAWKANVERIADILRAQAPAVVFLPHDADGHATHIGTHLLVRDALLAQADGPAPLVVETEFWAAMRTPNLMAASSIDDVADLVAALALHAGEVARNPYHLRLPAWMIDNVRRGSELIGGFRAHAPDVPFATLYRVSRLQDGALLPEPDPRILVTADDLRLWFTQVVTGQNVTISQVPSVRISSDSGMPRRG